MAETKPTQASTPAPAAGTGVNLASGEGQAADQPRLAIEAQYIKDLSFENPRSPESLAPTDERPDIKINVEVRAQGLNPGIYEVQLMIKAEAKRKKKVLFILELTYAGVIKLANIKPEAVQPVLLIECPRLLFPFARNIVADAVRDGGFPPLMLSPIDFGALFRQSQQAQSQQTPQAAPQAVGAAVEAAPALIGDETPEESKPEKASGKKKSRRADA